MKTLKTVLEEYNTLPVEFEAIHYSTKPNITHLSGDFYGKGIRGAESDRLSNADTRIKKRIYFYPKQTADTYPQPEAGLGNHVYSAMLKNIYDTKKPNKSISQTSSKYIKSGHNAENAFEMSVLDHGYSGYRTHNLAVVLNTVVPVKYEGTLIDKKVAPISWEGVTKTKTSLFDTIPNTNGEHSSELLSPEQMKFYYKNLADIQKAAPSTMLQYGRLNVHEKDLPSLKDYIQKTTSLEF
jgi:hypothetical protein